MCLRLLVTPVIGQNSILSAILPSAFGGTIKEEARDSQNLVTWCTATLYEKKHLKRLAIGEWPKRTFKAIRMAAIR